MKVMSNVLSFVGIGAARAESDEDKEKDKQEPAAETEEEKKKREEEEAAQKKAADEGDKEDEEKDEGAKSARARERHRVTAILHHATEATLQTALHLALNTDLPRSAVVGILSGMPAAAAPAAPRNQLGQAMQQAAVPHVGVAASAQGPGKPAGESVDAAASRIAGYVRRGGAR